MSLKTDRINLIININGDKARDQLNDLGKKAAGIKGELKKMVAGTAEYVQKSKELSTVEADMAGLKKQIGLTALSLRELGQERKRLQKILDTSIPGTKDFKNYENQLNAVIDRQKQVKGGVAAFSSGLSSVGTAVKGFGVLLAAHVGFEAISSFLSGSVEEAAQSEKAISRLRNTLDNLGRNDVFDRLSQKANDLAQSFKFIDNDDVLEVFQQLVTYGKLTENQIDDLTHVIINFAAKSGVSINESASLIIKSLEGNGKALKEYGINIKDGENVTERFGIVMDELAPKVAGAAEAFGNTFNGQVAISKQEIKNLQEELGGKLLPVLSKFYQSLSFTISGLGVIFNNTLGFFTSLKNGIVNTASVAKEFLTLNFAGAAAKIALINANSDKIKQRIKDEQTLSNIQQQVNGIASDAATKTISEQQVILKQNEALAKGSIKAYQDIKKAGKQGTEEGQQAAADVVRDLKTVQALRQGIAAAKNTKILGSGDDDNVLKNTSKTKSSSQSDNEYDRIKKEAEALYKQLHLLRDADALDGMDADQKEIARVKEKYLKLLTEEKEHIVKVAASHLTEAKKKGFTEGSDKRIAEINKEQEDAVRRFLQSKAEANFVTLAENEYQKALEDSRKYFDDLQKEAAQSYADGLISEDEYQDQIKAIARRSLLAKVQTASQYAQTVKSAEKDLVTFTNQAYEEDKNNYIKAQEAKGKARDALDKDTIASIEFLHQLQIAKASPKERKKLLTEDATKERDGKIEKLKKELQAAGKAFDDETLKSNTTFIAAWEAFKEQVAGANKSFWDTEIDNILRYAAAFTSAIESLNTFVSNKENKALAQEKKRNEEKQSSLKRQFDSKLISKSQYDKTVEKLNQEQDKKEKELQLKQAKRERAINIFKTSIDVGAAIVRSYLNAGGWPLGIPAGLAMAVIGGLQIAAVASAPLPELGKGDWIRKGPKHSDKEGGINALIERDEAVMSAAAMTDPNTYSITGNTAQITSLLNAKGGGVSWAGGAVEDMPQWRRVQPAAINPNMPRIMEQGGVTRPLSGDMTKATNEHLALLRELINESKGLRDDMQNVELNRKSYIVLKELDQEIKNLQTAKNNSGMLSQGAKATGLNL